MSQFKKADTIISVWMGAIFVNFLLSIFFHDFMAVAGWLSAGLALSLQYIKD